MPSKIESVWEDAPGRKDDDGKIIDKWIGVQINGIRKTQSGYVREGWWYFLRHFPDKEASYWYKKKRLPAKPGEEEGKIVEEYVGRELPFEIPPELAEAEWGVTAKRKEQKAKSRKKPTPVKKKLAPSKYVSPNT